MIGSFWAELAVAVTGDDAILLRPGNRLGKPSVRRDILEAGRARHFRGARQPVEDCRHHGAVQRQLRGEGRLRHADHQLLCGNVAHCLVEPGALRHIGKGWRTRSRDDLHPLCAAGRAGIAHLAVSPYRCRGDDHAVVPAVARSRDRLLRLQDLAAAVAVAASGQARRLAACFDGRILYRIVPQRLGLVLVAQATQIAGIPGQTGCLTRRLPKGLDREVVLARAPLHLPAVGCRYRSSSAEW